VGLASLKKSKVKRKVEVRRRSDSDVCLVASPQGAFQILDHQINLAGRQFGHRMLL